MTGSDPIEVAAHPTVRALSAPVRAAYFALLSRGAVLPSAEARGVAAHALRANPPALDGARAELVAAGLLAIEGDEWLTLTPALREGADVFAEGAARVAAQWADDALEGARRAEAHGVLGRVDYVAWRMLMDEIGAERRSEP